MSGLVWMMQFPSNGTRLAARVAHTYTHFDTCYAARALAGRGVAVCVVVVTYARDANCGHEAVQPPARPPPPPHPPPPQHPRYIHPFIGIGSQSHSCISFLCAYGLESSKLFVD